VDLKLIQPGKPTQNAYIESFDGKFRDECLNEHWFASLAEARFLINSWRRDYNKRRPHSSLKYQTPAEFAASARTADASERLKNHAEFNLGLCKPSPGTIRGGRSV
jgi:putative transposase